METRHASVLFPVTPSQPILCWACTHGIGLFPSFKHREPKTSLRQHIKINLEQVGGLYFIMDEQIPVDVATERVENSAGEKLNVCGTDGNQEPFEGMEFESDVAGRAFYDEYARRVGFVARVLSSRKSERDGSLISRGLGCRGGFYNKKTENHTVPKRDRQQEGCSAMILMKKERPGRWIIRKFVREHNHPLAVTLPKRGSTFDEKDKKIQELTAELRVKKRLSAAYREQLLVLMKDVEDHNEHLSTKVQVVRNNLKELEAKRLELLHHR